MTEIEGRTAVRQEAQDISGRTVAVVGLVAIVIGVLSVLVMAWILDERRDALDDRTQVPIAAPGVAASPIEHSRIELSAPGLELQARQRQRLHEWGWVKEGAVAHIPIEAAAEWLLRDYEAGELSSVPLEEAGGVETREDAEQSSDDRLPVSGTDAASEEGRP